MKKQPGTLAFFEIVDGLNVFDGPPLEQGGKIFLDLWKS